MSLRAGLLEIYSHVSVKRRRQLVLLLVLMLVAAVAEVATIGSVIPFLAILAQSHSTTHIPAALSFVTSFGAGFHDADLSVAASIFAGFAIFAALLRLQLAWVTQNFAYRLGHELALETQKRILAQPYVFYVERNSSSLVASTDKVEILIFDMVLPLMQGLIAGFIAAFLVTGLLYIDAVTTIVAAAVFTSIYILVSTATRVRLGENSVIVGAAYHERLKIEQESLGGIRDVIVDHSQAFHLKLFETVNSRLARARATTKFISQAPRFIVEGTGMVVLTVIAVMISRRPGGVALALPFLGALALGAQRLLPLLQTVYTGWSLSAGNRSIAAEIVELLQLPLPTAQEPAGEARLPLRKHIRLEGVSFFYPGRPHAPAIQDVTMEIPAGSTLALIGKTGSGKSTLADLLMGLLEPTSGRIRVDDVTLGRSTTRPWQENIAHVSQSIFLADTTIAHNIALSLPHLPPDYERIVYSAKQAQLDEFVASLPAGYETMIGERGIRLSGGQRQRLGIARAIYKGTSVLVFDEATSALDDETEGAVISVIDELRSTGSSIVIIAHRHSTVRHSDLVARLDGGRLVEFGPTSKVLRAKQGRF